MSVAGLARIQPGAMCVGRFMKFPSTQSERSHKNDRDDCNSHPTQRIDYAAQGEGNGGMRLIEMPDRFVEPFADTEILCRFVTECAVNVVHEFAHESALLVGYRALVLQFGMHFLQ